MMKFEHKFEYEWGGEDTWYTKSKRWAKKQNPIIRSLVLGFIEWLWIKWIEGKVKMEMSSVDKQAEEIVDMWEIQDKPIVKSEKSEVEGLDIISISTFDESDSSTTK